MRDSAQSDEVRFNILPGTTPLPGSQNPAGEEEPTAEAASQNTETPPAVTEAASSNMQPVGSEESPRSLKKLNLMIGEGASNAQVFLNEQDISAQSEISLEDGVYPLKIVVTAGGSIHSWDLGLTSS